MEETLEKRPLTQSSMNCVARCEEKYRVRYIEGLRRSEYTPALTVGTAFHAGIEHGSPLAADAVLLEAMEVASYLDKVAAIEAMRPVVRAMVSGALSLWADWPAPEAREVKFELPLINPGTGAPSTRHIFAGVFDGVFLPDELGAQAQEVRLLEMKTTSRLDADYLRRLALDPQISAYCLAASAKYGVPGREVVYRVVRKPSIRQRKNESPEEFADRVSADYLERPEFYFAEEIVTRTDAQLERWHHEMWESHRRVMRLENGGMSVRNTQHCLDFGRCDYFDLCRGVITADDFMAVDNVNPEL